MATRTELQRLAGMASCLRPDWPLKSLLTFLERDHAHRAYADLAVALAHVATDPKTSTPARLNEAGPWWQVTGSETTPVVGPGHESRCSDHEYELARNCRWCRADTLGGTPNPYRDEPRPEPVQRRPMPRVPTKES